MIRHMRGNGVRTDGDGVKIGRVTWREVTNLDLVPSGPERHESKYSYNSEYNPKPIQASDRMSPSVKELPITMDIKECNQNRMLSKAYTLFNVG